MDGEGQPIVEERGARTQAAQALERITIVVGDHDAGPGSAAGAVRRLSSGALGGRAGTRRRRRRSGAARGSAPRAEDWRRVLGPAPRSGLAARSVPAEHSGWPRARNQRRSELVGALGAGDALGIGGAQDRPHARGRREHSGPAGPVGALGADLDGYDATVLAVKSRKVARGSDLSPNFRNTPRDPVDYSGTERALAAANRERELQSADDRRVSERLPRVNRPALPGERGRERPLWIER